MAPAFDSPPNGTAAFSYDNPSKLVFPDGIKTSGQTDPNYDQIKPHEEFPKEITGPTVWKAKDYKDHPERWTHYFSDVEIQEMSEAADAFIASDTPLTGICKVCRLRRCRRI